ncbi:MAG TPA: catalase family peroxidase [Rhodocyclaceae bacterium]|nr:catalase family peroxidase [Rhodocyclaceae bacterium]
MQRNLAALATAAFLTLPQAAHAADEEPAADQVVGAIEAAFGVNPGQRRNHIKGTCAAGEFTGNPDAAAYSRSPLFSGVPIPVVARFSLSGGNPKAPDTAKSGRGMALEFRLPGGVLQHITMLNTPMFGAAKARTFLDLMVALRPDPATGKPDPERLKSFKATHPDNQAQADYLATNNPPASYGNSTYWGIHTFKFLARDGRTTLVRWRFVPQDGERRLTDEELKGAPADFLEKALIDRTARGPLRWDMMVTVGEPGDPQTDPTLPWPAGRREVRAGTLSITAAAPQRGAECERINFDPLVMADGMAPTDDPILLFRSPAYAVSFAKRLGGL